MHFQVERAHLLSALQATVPLSLAKSTIPILRNVQLATEPGQITVTATDTEVRMQVSVPAIVDAAGTTTVPAKQLLDIVSLIQTDAMIDAAMEGERLRVKAGRSVSRLPTLSADEFPAFTSGDTPGRVSVLAEDWKAATAAVTFAASDEQTRYYLCGIHIHEQDGALRFVATNGHILSLHDCACVGALHQSVIVPSAAVAAIDKMATRAETLEFEQGPTLMRVRIPGAEFTTRLVDGSFPDYTRVIPTHLPHRLTLPVKSMMESAKRVMVVSTEKTRTIAVTFAKSGSVTLRSTSSEGGESVDEIETQNAGPDLTVGFNGKYLLSVLDSLDAESAIVDIGDASSPAVWRDGKNGLRVLMPMRV